MIGEAVGAAVAKHGAIVGGLTIGTAAKYGLALTHGKRLTLKGNSRPLSLGIRGPLAISVSHSLALAGNTRVLAGALVAVSFDRLVRLACDQFMRSAEGQISKPMPPVKKEAVRRVPAGGGGEPDHIDVQAPALTERERVRANLRFAFGSKKSGPTNIRELLRKLD